MESEEPPVEGEEPIAPAAPDEDKPKKYTLTGRPVGYPLDPLPPDVGVGDRVGDVVELTLSKEQERAAIAGGVLRHGKPDEEPPV